MAMLTVEGFEVFFLPGTSLNDTKHGDLARAYSGKLRTDVIASHRTGHISASIYDTTNDAPALRAILNSPGPVLLGGTLIGDDAYFHVTNLVVSPITGTSLKFDFDIAETDGSPSALLFSFDGDAPGTYTFTRTGSPTNAWYPDSSGIWQQSTAANIARRGWFTLTADYDTQALMVELAATNDLLDTADVDPDDANWSESAAWTQAAATALIAGSTIKKFTNDGVSASHYVSSATPNLVGTSVVCSVIVENDDALETVIGLWDATATDWVVNGTYTWATGAFAEGGVGVGSSTGVNVETLAAAGPNGGKVVRLSIYGIADNAGNTGQLLIYPTGTGVNSLAAILHHAQHEDGIAPTSPIVTAGSALTRALETWYANYTPVPQAQTAYLKFKETGSIHQAYTRLLYIGSAADGDPRFLIYRAGAYYAAFHDDGVVAGFSAFLAVAPTVGQTVELRAGINADGSIFIGQSIDGGTETTATNATTASFKAAWSDTRLYLGSTSGGSAANVHPIGAKVVSGVRTMAEMRDWARGRLWPRQT